MTGYMRIREPPEHMKRNVAILALIVAAVFIYLYFTGFFEDGCPINASEGTCSDTTKITQETCVAAGTCSDVSALTEATCLSLTSPGTWTPETWTMTSLYNHTGMTTMDNNTIINDTCGDNAMTQSYCRSVDESTIMVEDGYECSAMADEATCNADITKCVWTDVPSTMCYDDVVHTNGCTIDTGPITPITPITLNCANHSCSSLGTNYSNNNVDCIPGPDGLCADSVCCDLTSCTGITKPGTNYQTSLIDDECVIPNCSNVKDFTEVMTEFTGQSPSYDYNRPTEDNPNNLYCNWDSTSINNQCSQYRDGSACISNLACVYTPTNGCTARDHPIINGVRTPPPAPVNRFADGLVDSCCSVDTTQSTCAKYSSLQCGDQLTLDSDKILTANTLTGATGLTSEQSLKDYCCKPIPPASVIAIDAAVCGATEERGYATTNNFIRTMDVPGGVLGTCPNREVNDANGHSCTMSDAFDTTLYQGIPTDGTFTFSVHDNYKDGSGAYIGTNSNLICSDRSTSMTGITVHETIDGNVDPGAGTIIPGPYIKCVADTFTLEGCSSIAVDHLPRGISTTAGTNTDAIQDPRIESPDQAAAYYSKPYENYSFEMSEAQSMFYHTMLRNSGVTAATHTGTPDVTPINLGDWPTRTPLPSGEPITTTEVSNQLGALTCGALYTSTDANDPTGANETSVNIVEDQGNKYFYLTDTCDNCIEGASPMHDENGNFKCIETCSQNLPTGISDIPGTTCSITDDAQLHLCGEIVDGPLVTNNSTPLSHSQIYNPNYATPTSHCECDGPNLFYLNNGPNSPDPQDRDTYHCDTKPLNSNIVSEENGKGVRAVCNVGYHWDTSGTNPRNCIPNTCLSNSTKCDAASTWTTGDNRVTGAADEFHAICPEQSMPDVCPINKLKLGYYIDNTISENITLIDTVSYRDYDELKMVNTSSHARECLSAASAATNGGPGQVPIIYPENSLYPTDSYRVIHTDKERTIVNILGGNTSPFVDTTRAPVTSSGSGGTLNQCPTTGLIAVDGPTAYCHSGLTRDSQGGRCTFPRGAHCWSYTPAAGLGMPALPAWTNTTNNGCDDRGDWCIGGATTTDWPDNYCS